MTWPHPLRPSVRTGAPPPEGEASFEVGVRLSGRTHRSAPTWFYERFVRHCRGAPMCAPAEGRSLYRTVTSRRGAVSLVVQQTPFPPTKAVTADARYCQYIISTRRVRFSNEGQSTPFSFSFDIQDRFLFLRREKENGLGPARAARPSGPGRSH